MSAEHDIVSDLIAAAALGAATPEELSRVERHAATCAVCAEEFESFRQTAGALALAVPSVAPPPDLRGRIMREAARERSARPQAAPRRRFALGWPAVSGALAVCVIGLLGWNLSLQTGEDPAPRVIPVTASVGTGGQVSLVAGAGRRTALLRLNGLPEPEAGKGWALWRIPTAGPPVSAGFLERQPDGSYLGTVDVSGGPVTLGVTPEALTNRRAPSVEPVAAVALPA